MVGLTKRFGGLTALDDVSLRVTPGSFHALLGENGAGKTTLVKCVVGYQRPDAGAVLVGRRERDIRSPADAHALGIGMVYQVSEDLDEILALSDRVVVMSGGRIVHATPIGAADIAVIGSAMAGHHAATLG